MEKITKVSATIQKFGNIESVLARVETERGFLGEASVPVGISIGSGEAKYIANADAVNNINNIVAKKIIGLDALEQREVDQELMYLDLTPDRRLFGVNSLMPVSMAVCRAASNALSRELYEHLASLNKSVPHIPSLVSVLVSGGRHQNNPRLIIQEYSGIFLNPNKIIEALNHLGAIFRRDGIAFVQNDIGSLSPIEADDSQIFRSIAELSNDLNLDLAYDFASSHSNISAEFIESIMQNSKSCIAEDPIAEDNLTGWTEFTKKWGSSKIVSADDLTLGNPILIKDALKANIANCLVVKINQSTTLSELFDIIALVKIGNWSHIVSHRGQETADDFIVDLAVGTGALYLKMGTPISLMRKSKFDRYNKILDLSQIKQNEVL